MPKIPLQDGRFYPTSFTPAQLLEFGAFVKEHSRTVTLGEVSAGDIALDAIAIQHDLDNDARYGLRFAQWEHDRGIRSTYFFLPTGVYWETDARRCAVAIQELGHEVGLHNDALVAEDGLRMRALTTLQVWADEMRSWGINVRGVSDHGGSNTIANGSIWEVVTPQELGFDYEAYQLHRVSNYISDNHGAWRSPLVRTEKQTHILMHPCHWALP